MASETQTKNWKLKYRELVHELESKETQWSEIERVLRTAVSRLALAAMGQNANLDRTLERIRTHSKDKVPVQYVERDVARLSKALTRMELTQSTETPESISDPTDWFLDLLFEVKNALDNPDALDRLIADTQQGKLTMDVAVQRFGKLIPKSNTVVKSESTSTDSHSPFIELVTQLDLSQDLNKKLQQTLATTTDSAEVLALLSQELNAIINHDSSPPDETTSTQDLTKLLRLLSQQFEDLPELKDAMSQILGKLDDGVPEQGWPQLLTELADTLSQAIHGVRAEKTELEAFLDDVTQQLAQFEDWARWSQSQIKGRHGDTIQLQDDMSNQFRILQEDVDATTDLGDLKTKVSQRLENVANHITAFRNREDSHLQDSLQRNAELQKEIEGLKGKTDKIVKLWGEQRTRLMYDTLTHVYSRYAYDQRLMEEFKRWKRHSSPLVFSIWDIDRFKRVNDTYGHRAGDRLLQLVAKILSENTRTEDFLARIGGEEFVMLLPSTPPKVALGLVNKLREQVAKTPFHYRGSPESITISCGLTHFQPGDTPMQVYNRADEALYKAKKKGRNCCISV